MGVGLVERLRRAPRWLNKKLAPGGIILCYHRVAEAASDPYQMCVTPRHFAEHLEVLRRYGRPTSLRQLTAAVRAGRRPRRAAVVTFDDGYASNLHVAKPLLERFDFPATVFVASGGVGGGRGFWWDELEGLLLRPGTLPETLTLRVGGSEYRWELDGAARYGEDSFARDRRWHWGTPEGDDPGPRQRVFRAVYKLLHPLGDDERRQALDQLSAQAGAGRPAVNEDRSLSPVELLNLAEGGLVEVGAHTVTHPRLSTLPAGAQRAEITQSKGALEEFTGRPVTSFAYPHGDYAGETPELVRGAGFDCACAAQQGAVQPSADLFRLPRLVVGDCDGEELAAVVRWLALG